MASNFSSCSVSMRATRRTLASMTSWNARSASTVSPTINTSECGIVPIGSASMSSADLVTATPSQPPMKALRSIMGAIVGCIRRAPNEITCRSPAAFLQRAALVAMPEAWQRGLVLRPLDVGALEDEHGLIGREQRALVHRAHGDRHALEQRGRLLD